MPIPKLTSIQTHEIDPQYCSMYEVTVNNQNISSSDAEWIRDNTISIDPFNITFNTNVVANKLQPYTIISNIMSDRDSSLSIDIRTYDKNGVVTGKFTYGDVTVDSVFPDIDFGYERFDHIMGPVSVNIVTGKLLFNDVEIPMV